MKGEFIGAVEAIMWHKDSSRYTSSFGVFQGYDTNTTQDKTGKRFCNVKLQYKDRSGRDIDTINVPLVYFGTKNSVVDYELEKGDEVLVFFTDHAIDIWKTMPGLQPEDLSLKNAITHAFAIPINTHHTAPTAPTHKGLRQYVKPGEKVSIGNGTDEVLDLFDQVLTLLQGSVDAAGSASTGTNSLINAQLATIQTKLGNLKV